MTDSSLTTLGVLILLLPLAGAVLAAVLGPRVAKGSAHWPVVAGVGGAAVCALLLLRVVAGGPAAHEAARPVLYAWFAAGAAQWFNVEFWIDPLTAIMLATVTVVATLVVMYSRDYMRDHGHPERGYARFFAFLGLFVFSMALLVLGGNFLLLYMGWELVGLCSYLLIGFYYEKPSAAAAAKKAFLVNRIGDFGFGLGVLLILLTFGHADYHTVFAAARAAVEGHAAEIGHLLNLAPAEAAARMTLIADRLPVIALLLFCGAVGKSAQFPLYVWLPDAMEGPSPVSALIHAATMVTAGVYMTVRCGAIFAASPAVLTFIAIIGAGTALFAATIALVQTDVKRILAYSTISQLGYMFLGVGVAAADSAVFHLFTHAFFKALLFLGAGSVMHAMGGVIDVRRFGGLRRIMPVTCWTMVIGSAALAGFPLLAGFFSKDEIVHHAFARHPLFGAVGLVTAALTSFYTFRMIFLTFWGTERVPDGVHSHESPVWMMSPLVLLAFGALVAGYAGVHVQGGGFLGFIEPGGAFHRFLEPVVAPFHAAAEHAPAHEAAAEGGLLASIAHHWLMYLSAVIAIGGAVVAYMFYVSRPWLPHVVRTRFAEAHFVLRNKYFMDEAYDEAFVKPLRATGEGCFRIDEFVIDGLLWMVTAVPRLVGYVFRGLQSGAMQGYGLSMAAGVAIMIVLALLVR